MHLKSIGAMTVRMLSYEVCEFETVVVKVVGNFRKIYNRCTDLWTHLYYELMDQKLTGEDKKMHVCTLYLSFTRFILASLIITHSLHVPFLLNEGSLLGVSPAVLL